jgi:hypothetical protein
MVDGEGEIPASRRGPLDVENQTDAGGEAGHDTADRTTRRGDAAVGAGLDVATTGRSLAVDQAPELTGTRRT